MPENIFRKIFELKGKAKLWWGFAAIMVLTAFTLLVDFGPQYNRFVSSVGLSKLQVKEVPFKLGLDLLGGSQLTYKADVSAIAEADRKSAVDGARDVIERRVNSMGVSEPRVEAIIAPSGEYRIVVELAGIRDIKEAIKKIGETPLLEFKEANDKKRDLTDKEKKDITAYNNTASKKATDILGKLSKGGDFNALAKSLSEDSDTKDKGGALGWIKSNDYPELTAAANKTAKGKVDNELIKTSTGYEIIKFNDKRVAKDKDGKELVESKLRRLVICSSDIKDCTSGLSKDEAKQKAEKLKSQANKDNFKDLVKANTTETGGKERLGDFGWLTEQEVGGFIDKSVFALKSGTVSNVLETSEGYVVYLKEGERKVDEYNLNHILVKTKSAEDVIGKQDDWKNTQLTGRNLKRASVAFDPNSNEPQVSLEFDSEGAKLFGEITERNVGKPVAIFLDGNAISVPTVNEKITGGKAVINGKFGVKEAKDLAKRLNAGALPVPIDLINQQTVGASLGREAVDYSLKAGIIGLILVAIFMIIVYRLPGLLSVISLLIYGALVLAVFKWQITLTLPGIAGLIMSIGVAVDANVLIFERMKEELRAGKSLTRAIDEGFHRAWPSIRDGNFTTIITCLVLMFFSTSIIKGFAVTLFLGILVSLFTAITVTRTFLKLIDERVLTKHHWLICRIKK